MNVKLLNWEALTSDRLDWFGILGYEPCFINILLAISLSGTKRFKMLSGSQKISAWLGAEKKLWNSSSKKHKSEHKNRLIEYKIGFVVIITINYLGNGRLLRSMFWKKPFYRQFIAAKAKTVPCALRSSGSIVFKYTVVYCNSNCVCCKWNLNGNRSKRFLSISTNLYLKAISWIYLRN